MVKKIGLLLGVAFFGCVLTLNAAVAAQTGKITTDQAPLREYPQAGARVLANVQKDEVVSVSNLQTDGFYKARIRTGQIGWISGNDVLVTGAAPAVARGAVAARGKKVLSSPQETFRIRASYGLNFTSFGGLNAVFPTTGLSNTSLYFEAAYKLTQKLYAAFRLSITSGTAATTVTQASGASAAQVLKDSLMPIELGLTWDFMRNNTWRFGAGLYGGISVSSTMTVDQTTTLSLDEVKYASVDPSGTLVLMGAYSFGDTFGVFLETGYHFQPTGTFAATTHFGGANGFSIDYSGMIAEAGLELKF